VEWRTGDNNDRDNDNEADTHPHTNEQLLVKWMVGAPGLKKGQMGMTTMGEGQQKGEETKAGKGRQGHMARRHTLMV
jgi:hypothetical protein